MPALLRSGTPHPSLTCAGVIIKGRVACVGVGEVRPARARAQDEQVVERRQAQALAAVREGRAQERVGQRVAKAPEVRACQGAGAGGGARAAQSTGRRAHAHAPNKSTAT